MMKEVISYIQKYCISEEPNFLQRAIFCLMSPFFKCLIWVLDIVNQNAILWNAIYGSDFCTSAGGGTVLKLCNKARCVSLLGVSGLVLFIGKIGVSTLCTGIITVIMVFASPYKHDISSPMLPATLVFLISYTFVTLFIGVYSATIDTIFLCFLIDEKVNGGNSEKMLCSDKLRELVNKYAPLVGDDCDEIELLSPSKPEQFSDSNIMSDSSDDAYDIKQFENSDMSDSDDGCV